MKTKTIKLSDILANEKLSLSPKDYIGRLCRLRHKIYTFFVKPFKIN